MEKAERMEKIEESEVKIIRAATPKISEEDVFEEEKIEYIQPRIIPFEEEYFDVMNNPINSDFNKSL